MIRKKTDSHGSKKNKKSGRRGRGERSDEGAGGTWSAVFCGPQKKKWGGKDGKTASLASAVFYGFRLHLSYESMLPPLSRLQPLDHDFTTFKELSSMFHLHSWISKRPLRDPTVIVEKEEKSSFARKIQLNLFFIPLFGRSLRAKVKTPCGQQMVRGFVEDV